jgi:hypothetical protein
MKNKTEMIRIRCTGKTKSDFESLTFERGFKNLEDSLQFLMDHYRKTHHLLTGKVY